MMRKVNMRHLTQGRVKENVKFMTYDIKRRTPPPMHFFTLIVFFCD